MLLPRLTCFQLNKDKESGKRSQTDIQGHISDINLLQKTFPGIKCYISVAVGA